MKSSSNRLIATVIGTILLPIVLYSVYEITSVKESEEVIEKIYRDQLDAIIFSVNQFSNDNVNALLNKLEEELTDSLTLTTTKPFLKYSNLHAFILDPLPNGPPKLHTLNPELTLGPNWKKQYDSLLAADVALKNQLIRYEEGGYRKVEPRGTLYLGPHKIQIIHAVLDVRGKKVYFTGLLSIQGFAENVLAPRLQQIAERDLIIALQYRKNEQLVYVTDSLSNNIMLSKSMWLFPELDVGISSSNKTVSELVNERTTYNLAATFILILLLLFGFGLVIRNLRKDISLAEAKSDFVSNVSHELRTPLSLISMFAETLMLDRVPSPKKRKEYEEIIYKETNRLTGIVNKILNFSQMEANKRTYHMTTCDLNLIVEELLHDYAYHLERNGFTYTTSFTPDLSVISADKEAIYEALVNLVDNAIKYSPETKHLELRTEESKHTLQIVVMDQGMGIPTEKQRLIFDKFYRVSEGNVHTTQGAGLGLTLVSRIMEAHGGKAEVDHNPTGGSIFKLIFHKDKHGADTDR
ncbi:sensor histidine kinase [Marinoscillum furvescens]|uniref:histidine kinase n=1 Tax=Marinoscillum furvescens DSM 4134 TaxID=1122208 RepID=A0A3D9LIY2_MARFU|nr:HAMP domain-containing sensor histidine kinase [Marinoscillum furvescens]REE05773.1 two-component system phosphate regulon sensor histidine kinase PhoR [Marinoscillum furvescens DSM 4134]